MTKSEIKNILNNLLSNGVITNQEYSEFINMTDSTSEDELDSVRLRILDFLNLRINELNAQFLDEVALYSESLTRLRDLLPEDEELKMLVDEFNQNISSALDDFNNEMDKISSDFKEVSKMLDEAVKAAETHEEK